MGDSASSDDVIFNFFKQICDEKDDQKCLELGNNWINAMETNLINIKTKLDPKDKIKNLEEYIDGSPAINYDPQTNISY